MKRPTNLLPALLVICLLSMAAVPAAGTASSYANTFSRQVDDQWAEHVLDTLSLNEKIAQLLVVQEAPHLENQLPTRQAVDRGVGGIRVCQRNPLLQANYLNQLQYRAALPLLVTQNSSCRSPAYREPDTRMLPLTALAAAQEGQLVHAYARMVGQQARLTGVHQIYGPSADLVRADDLSGPTGPNYTTRAFIEGVRASGLLSTPGYAPDQLHSTSDSYVQQISTASAEAADSDTPPAGIGKSTENITIAWPGMTIDPGSVLPSFQESTGYQGLVTVDLAVSGRTFDKQELEQMALEAIQSGADQLVIRPDDMPVHRVLRQAVREGRLTEERIDRSVSQILRVKQGRSLHQRRDVDLNAVAERVKTDQWTAMNREVARRSLTLLSNTDELLPLSPVDETDLLHVAFTEDRDREDGRYFRRQLREQNPSGSVIHRVVDRRSTAQSYRDIELGTPHYDTIVVSMFLEEGPSDAQRRLIDEMAEYELPIIVVNFSDAATIDRLDGAHAALLAWSSIQPAQDAAAQALFGRSRITGRLPSTISPRYPAGTGRTIDQQYMRPGAPEEVGMTRRPFEQIDRLLEKAVADSAFPGAAVAIGRSGVLTKLRGYGYETYESSRPVTPHSQFDLASLTKVIATTTAAMKLYESGQLDLAAPVTQYWPAFGRHEKDKITVRHLLTHTSGLRPFYHPVTQIHATPFFRLTRPFTPFFRMEIQSKEEMFDFIARDTLQYDPGERYRYSDLNMITLAHLIERITGDTLNDFLQAEIFDPLGMTRTKFRSTGPAAVNDPAVPTEIDRTFRARLVRGEVHDEAAYIMGGTAGHAGLFSTAHDLALFADMLLRGGNVAGKQLLQPETIELFTTPVNPDDHTRALGWDTKSPSGYSSAGELFGPNSFGHTGFTGTSFWIDPDQQLFLVLLTNRVHPTRANRKHIPIRPDVADIAYRSIQGPADILLSELLGLP